MLTSLLLGLFKRGTTPILAIPTAIYVRQIKDVRNSKIVAHGFSTNISSQDFENSWNVLEVAILSIAGLKGNASYLDKVKTKMNQTLLSKLPGMWNSCAKWFTSVIEEQADTIRHLKTVVDTGTEVQRHPSGKDQKRFKTVNEKHKTLKHGSMVPIMRPALNSWLVEMKNGRRENFKTLMANSSLDDSELTTSIAEIRQKLASNKVIVTGDGYSQYESVALSAIKGMPNFDEEFCVAINDPHEWMDMEKELVRVVVFKDPFGSEEFDRIHCNKIVEIFERIEKSKTRKMTVPLTAVILTQKRILKYAFDFVSVQDQELFGEICEPCKTGSDDNSPINVEVGRRHSLRKKYQPRSQTMKNMLDLSSVYLEGRQNVEVQKKTKYAFEELEKNGCLVVTGEESSDVSLFVANLATREKGKNTIYLQCPSDIRHVEISVTDTLIIEFFAGQFVLELGRAKEWMETFDFLYALSQKRKLSIICSSTRSVFDALKESIPRIQPIHSLLSRVVDISKNNILQEIKLEPDARGLDARAVTSAQTFSGRMNIEYTRAIETSPLTTKNQMLSGPPLILGNSRVSSAPTKPQKRKNMPQWNSDSSTGPHYKRSRIRIPEQPALFKPEPSILDKHSSVAKALDEVIEDFDVYCLNKFKDSTRHSTRIDQKRIRDSNANAKPAADADNIAG